MAHLVSFTLSQLFKAKGGYVRHNAEGMNIRIQARIGQVEFIGRTGIDLRGFRSLENAMKQVLVGETFDVEPTAKSSLGVDMAFIRRNFPAGEFLEKVSSMEAEILRQQESYDELGFFNEHAELVRGTPADYFNGEDIDVIVCPNEKSKNRLIKLGDLDEGVWEGLEYKLKSDKLPVVTDLSKIINAWLAAEYVKDALCAPAEDDWNKIVEEEESESKDTTGEEMVRLFLRGWREHLTSKPEHEREKVFWGGGNKPASNRKRNDLVGVCFPPDEELSLEKFMCKVKENLINLWGFDDQKSEMGDVDIDRLVVGQMLRARGQLILNYKERRVRYEPRPAAYQVSQAKLKE